MIMTRPDSNLVTYSIGGLCTVLLALALITSTGVHTITSNRPGQVRRTMSHNDDNDSNMNDDDTMAGQGSAANDRDDWKNITDPKERRMAQNRIAQRRYRHRQQRQNEERAQIAAQHEAATSAYNVTEPEDLRSNDNPSGLPWGAIDIRNIVERGHAREQQSQASGAGSSPAGGGASGGN